MVLTGLVAVPICLNFIVMYTGNTARILQNWDSKELLSLLKIYSKRKILDLFRMSFLNMCAAMQSVSTCFPAVTNINL